METFNALTNEFTSITTANPTFAADKFIRSTMIKLAADSSTPADVAYSLFSDVELKYTDVMYCDAHVEMDYSASIGYNRVEQYLDREKRRDSNFEEYYVTVVKERVVTDWHPYSGHIGRDANACALNRDNEFGPGSHSYGSDDDGFDSDILTSVVSNTRASQCVEEDPHMFAPSRKAISIAGSRCAEIVKDEVTLPGDCSKGWHADSKITITDLNCYRFPFYKTTFSYKDNSYSSYAYATTDDPKDYLRCEYPKDSTNYSYYAKTQTHGKLVASIICWVLCGLFMIASFVLCGLHVTTLGIAPAAIMYGVSVGIHVSHDKEYNQTINYMVNNYVALKRKNLDSALVAYGYAPLNQKEAADFDSQTNESGRHMSYSNSIHRFVAPTVIFAILLAALLATSVITGLGGMMLI